MDIYDLRFDFEKSCINEFKIYAHENELLNEHNIKTKIIFQEILDEDVILNFYNYFHEHNHINLDYNEFKEIINTYIEYHDVGKISPKFQIEKLNKNSQQEILKKYKLTELTSYLVDKHSFISALSFIVKHKDLIEKNQLFIVCLAYAIQGHHTNLKNILEKDGFAYDKNFDSYLDSISFLMIVLGIASKNQIKNSKFTQSFFQDIQDSLNKFKTQKDSTFSFFYNYIYSLLITSDVLASAEYNKTIDEVKCMKHKFNNRICDDLKKVMLKSFYKVKYNTNLDNESYVEDVSNFEDIDSLRQNMLLESSFNLKNCIYSNNNSRIFYLNIPTGGGKTNTSMKLALDLIENTRTNRIIYAMPFINIIEQNYEIILETFGLDEDKGEIRKIYSASESITNRKNNKSTLDIILEDNLFNYPVICTTFPTLFNSLISSSKRNKYKISAFTNSVIILDEIQSLPLNNWISLYYLITEMSEKYNIYFIIMSATLPNFEKLKLDYNNELTSNSSFHLINNPGNYFNHHLFDRTVIKSYNSELSIDDSEKLKQYLFKDIIEPNFKNGFKKGLIILNTIKTSRLVFDLLSEYNDEFEIDLLNSSLLPSTKQNIIYKINNMKTDKKYILVSTQSIEAGIDVSFDFVIRDFAILDSIEQVRGRCNRNRELNKHDPTQKGNVYLINISENNTPVNRYIYNDEEIKTRIKETDNLFKNKINYNYSDIKEYYDNVSKSINKLESNKEDNFRYNDWDNIIHWNLMEYSKLNKKSGINIIGNKLKQYPIFIPTNIRIFNEKSDYESLSDIDEDELKQLYESNKENFVFSLNEIEYLKNINKKENINLFDKLSVNGEELRKYYEKSIKKSKNKSYTKTKIIKEISSILYKFIINVSPSNKSIKSKIEKFDKEDYFYILPKEMIGDGEDKLYSTKFGFNYSPKIKEK